MSDKLFSDSWKNPTVWAFRQAAEQAAGAATQAPSKVAGATAHGILASTASIGRALGLDNAADNLDHFLEGTGRLRHIPRDEARQRAVVQSSEHLNKRRFEKAFLLDRVSSMNRSENRPEFEYRSRLLDMRDGDTIRVPAGPPNKTAPRDVYDHVRTPEQLLRARNFDEALATGHSQFSSEAKDGFTAKRDGNRIVVEGIVTHSWIDTYDFDGGFESDLPETARDHGTAKEYANSTVYRQKLRTEFIVKHGELEPRSYQWTDVE